MDSARRRRELFFIVGTGRCGTTLLQSLLSSHPNLYIPRETHFWYEFHPRRVEVDPASDPVGYAEAVTKRSWWQQLEGVDPARLLEAVRCGVTTPSELLIWLLEELTPPQFRRRRLGEKSPHHERCAPQLAEEFPEAKFIYLMRDPRDVTESLLRMNWWPCKSVYRTARSWAKSLDRARHNQRLLGNHRYMLLRYEDLVTSPRAILDSVLEFLGEAPAPVAFHTSRESTGLFHRDHDHVAQAVDPINTRNIRKYPARLRPAEIRTIEWTAGDRLRRYGYSLDRSVRRPPGWQALALRDLAMWKLLGR